MIYYELYIEYNDGLTSIYTNDNDDGKSEDRESTENAPANDVNLEKTRSITRWLDTSDHFDEPDTFPKARRSDTSKENENMGVYENTSSIEVLQKIFPKHSLSILEIISKAYDNDLIRATESLMLENGMLRFPTPPVSPEDSTTPSDFHTPDSEQSQQRPIASIFTSVEHNSLLFTSSVATHSTFTRDATIYLCYVPYSLNDQPYILPARNLISMPFHPYMRPHAWGGGGLMLHSSNGRETRTRSRCSPCILPSHSLFSDVELCDVLVYCGAVIKV